MTTTERLRATACPYCGERGKLTLRAPYRTGWGDTWRDATEAERMYAECCGTTVAADHAAPLLDAAPARKARRITSPDDVAPLLRELVAAAEADERMTPSALLVLRALVAAALTRNPPHVEAAASAAWLTGTTGLGRKAVRLALVRLDRMGYARTITPRQVTSLGLRAWLAGRQVGRPPHLVRLADSPPVAL